MSRNGTHLATVNLLPGQGKGRSFIGAKIFRVHDVAETNKAFIIANKIFNSNHLIS